MAVKADNHSEDMPITAVGPEQPDARADDAFTSRFLNRVPTEVAQTFTPDQLAVIQRLFGNTDTWRRHSVDVRFTIPLLWRRIYVVLLAGRERRSGTRLAAEAATRPISRFLGMIIMIMLWLGMASPVLLMVYLAQAALTGAPATPSDGSILSDLIEQLRTLVR